MPYFVYLLLCADNSLYTGITTDTTRRLSEHNHSPKGAKYTRMRRPVTLVYSEIHPNRSEAQVAEARIKKLSHSQKLALIKDNI
jgi:putative endonuclease